MGPAVALHGVAVARMAKRVAEQGDLAMVQALRDAGGMTKQHLGRSLLTGFARQVFVQGLYCPLDGIELVDPRVRLG